MIGALHLAVVHGICCLATGRQFSKTLTVDNGGTEGDWKNQDFCPESTYAIGYETKLQEYGGAGFDDTALNGVKLVCGDKRGNANGSHATSETGSWGLWKGETLCPTGKVVVGFRLNVELDREHEADHTAANNMMVRCREFGKSGLGYITSPSCCNVHRGLYGSWSENCAVNTAVCGIRTKVQAPQGVWADDTTLNDVELYCCGQ